MRVTIKDIAKELNVSATAVSRALNNRGKISEALRQKVILKAKELGYQKNQIASSLVTKKSNTIGIFLLGRSFETRYNILQGIIEEAKKHNNDIVLFTLNDDLGDETSYVDLCRQRMVDGAIFMGLRSDDPHIEELKNSDIPVVILDRDIGGNANIISMDNDEAVKKGLNFLKVLNHENIAIVTGHKEAQVSEEFVEFSRKYLGDKFKEENVFYSNFDEESGYKCALEMLVMDNFPTAVFAIQDMVAYGIVQCFKSKGIKVPEKVSVMGFNDTNVSKYMVPNLTTVYQNDFKKGEEAVKLILGEKKGMKVLVKPELVIRDSCNNRDEK